MLPTISGRWQAGLLIGAVIALLAVVHVRVQLIGQGYQLAQAVERVDELIVERQRLKARVGALRNPERLNEHAGRLGLAQPVREFTLRRGDRMDP
jgi:cell division protein FtsL